MQRSWQIQPARAFPFFIRQRSLQNFTSSHTRSHFLRQVAAGGFVLPPEIHAQLAGIEYERCLAVMAVLEGPSHPCHRPALLRPRKVRSPGSRSGPLLLQGSIRGEAAFSLELTPTKPLVIFGENGVSRKGAAPTASSHYLTFSRLAVAGEVTLAGRKQAVHGQAWMDHEISSSQLDDDQAGWDWASLQLNDSREIMAYRLRKKDGRTDPFSQLAWVDAQGGVTNRNSTQFTWTTLRTWKSQATGGVYPVHVKLTTTDPGNGQSVSFTLEPIILPQELKGGLGGIPYWEGACRVLDDQGANVGSAYLELTGYVGSLADRFK